MNNVHKIGPAPVLAAGSAPSPARSASLYCPDAFISPLEIDEAVRRALAEDLGRAGDVTSIATVPEDAQARALVVARQAGTVSGLPLVEAVIRKLAPDAQLMAHARDGDAVPAKTPLMTVTGNARAVLAAERTALNFAGHLSGIATATGSLVDRLKGTNTRLVCTRKTTPGLRALQKYAVRCGGGFNHRFGLDDAVLIKDNHIAVAGGIRPVLERAKSMVGHLVKIEIEVDSIAQLREVLDTDLADVVLVDNFTVPMLKEAVALVGGRLVIEASGGITHDNAGEIAATGVDYISSGAITHSARNLDIALDIEV
jgi:nicotinate-nucleotide pyrophosphorylase (carboxylating)